MTSTVVALRAEIAESHLAPGDNGVLCHCRERLLEESLRPTPATRTRTPSSPGARWDSAAVAQGDGGVLVVALREIAESFLRPDDLREDLIHSLQKQVEIDEPDVEEVPTAINGAFVAQTDANIDTQFDRMTEEDLLRGLEGMAPPPEHNDDEGNRQRGDFG